MLVCYNYAKEEKTVKQETKKAEQNQTNPEKERKFSFNWSEFVNKKEDKKLERWERIIYEAAKQSKRGQIPKLRGILNFKEALEDMKSNDLNIAPYENERTKSIKQAIKGVNINTIGIFVGPEGGFEESEIESIEEIGGKSVSLGPRILRTETASLVASSIALYELSDLGGDE